MVVFIVPNNSYKDLLMSKILAYPCSHAIMKPASAAAMHMLQAFHSTFKLVMSDSVVADQGNI